MLYWLKKRYVRSGGQKDLLFAIKSITGCKPRKIALYKLALRHSSASHKNGQLRLNNERLEYLGDAILGAAVANYLYRHFPHEEEGFLTSMRSKIVSRQSLNRLGEELGLPHLLVKNKKGKMRSKSLYGNALEALIGALYLDCGYKKAQHFIEQKLIEKRLDLDDLSRKVASYKGALLEWAQKEKIAVQFHITGCWGESHAREYQISLLVNGQLMGTGFGDSKKKAEEAAAKEVYCTKLQANGQA